MKQRRHKKLVPPKKNPITELTASTGSPYWTVCSGASFSCCTDKFCTTSHPQQRQREGGWRGRGVCERGFWWDSGTERQEHQPYFLQGGLQQQQQQQEKGAFCSICRFLLFTPPRIVSRHHYKTPRTRSATIVKIRNTNSFSFSGGRGGRSGRLPLKGDQRCVGRRQNPLQSTRFPTSCLSHRMELVSKQRRATPDVCLLF